MTIQDSPRTKKYSMNIPQKTLYGVPTSSTPKIKAVCKKSSIRYTYPEQNKWELLPERPRLGKHWQETPILHMRRRSVRSSMRVPWQTSWGDNPSGWAGAQSGRPRNRTLGRLQGCHQRIQIWWVEPMKELRMSCYLSHQLNNELNESTWSEFWQTMFQSVTIVVS